MLILELAVQGVRGFSPSARVAFKAGYTVLKSPTEIPAPLAGLGLRLRLPGPARAGGPRALCREARGAG